MTIDLEGRSAIVTGGTRGIGLAIAQHLSAAGASVLLIGTDSERLEASLSTLPSTGSTHSVMTGDVADRATAESAARTAFKNHKRLDILVNNAGILQDGLLGMIKTADIERTLAVNVAGALHFTQACSRLINRSPNGSIINMASIIGRVGNSGQALYGASKAAIIGATHSSAKELAPHGTRVNAIAPGFIETDMTSHLDETTRAERLASIGMQRPGTVDDVARVALFLASDLSTYVSGQVIGVDGSMVI